MKLNNKGFAISGVLYSLLILFVTLFIGVLTILASTKFSLDKVKNDINNKLETLIYRDTILNGADPELKTGMIPVTIDADGTVKKADVTEKWYDYDTKMWANAVTVSETNRDIYKNSEAGTVIAESDILTYLVWVPRYKYKLWYEEVTDSDIASTNQTINIIFESKNIAKSNGSTNGQYLTHPAFTFGEEELNGIWVGKFETGYNGATTSTESEITATDSAKVVIKPNVYSWRNNIVSNMFYTVLGMNDNSNIFGLSTDSDTHMMKNTEWAAVAYLSHSKYGMNAEVYINNNGGYMTGCGGDTAAEESVSECKNKYGTKTDGIYNQSTTGNITGIFDMSGGANEYVMGYYAFASETWGATSTENYAGFTETPEEKYFNAYLDTDSKNACTSVACYGHAFTEVSAWYNDSVSFISETSPWVLRGGRHEGGNITGLFYYSRTNGSASTSRSFRVVHT